MDEETDVLHEITCEFIEQIERLLPGMATEAKVRYRYNDRLRRYEIESIVWLKSTAEDAQDAEKTTKT